MRRTSTPTGVFLGSTGTLQTARPKPPTFAPSTFTPGASVRRAGWSWAAMQRLGCRCCNAHPPHRPWHPAHRKNASTRTSAMAYGPCSPRLLWHRVKASGIGARRAPAPLLPCLWPMWCPNCPRGSATTGWWIISRPTGASRAAVGSPRGAVCRAWPRRGAAGHSGARSCASRPIRMCATFPPNTAHGSTKWKGGFVSWRGVCSRAALSMRPKLLQPAGRTLLRSTTPITRIRIGGRLRDTPWCALHRLGTRVVNNVMVGRGVAHRPNDVHGPFIRPDLLRGLLHNWQRTYETDI
jgi:hypothetical protein